MRFVFHLILMFAVALTVGFGLSWYALTDNRFFGTVQSGPWVAWPDAGAPSPNPYTRAHLARTGTLPLGQSEGLQFVASTDSEGRHLTRACTYRIEGHAPVSTFWTLAAVDEAGRNVARPDTRLALRSSNIVRTGEDPRIVIHAGTRLAPGNWLELTGEGPFSLILTLYDTVVSSGFGSSAGTMPAVAREAC